MDTLIGVHQSGHYKTQLYIKPEAASIILPFDSAQPFKLKKSVAKSQFLRALRVSSDPLSAKRSTDMLLELFRSNGYPPRWLHGVARQALEQHNRQKYSQTRTDDRTRGKLERKDRIYVSLSFISDSLTRKVDAALKSVHPGLTAPWKNTLAKRLVRSALEPPPCRAGKRFCRTCSSGLHGRCTTKYVVYQITCTMCVTIQGPPQTYVGETKQFIKYRFDEHFRDGTNRTRQTPFGEHMRQCHPGAPEPRHQLPFSAYARTQRTVR